MKGYAILFCAATVLLWWIPLGLAGNPAALPSEPVAPPVSADTFTVVHSEDATVMEEIDAFELTLYETMAAIAPDAPTEAIKAQAVACYTACRYQQGDTNEPVQTTLPFPQAYTEAYWTEQWGEQASTRLAIYREAVEAVKGKLLTYEGKPIMAVYHAMNVGKTENASVLWGEELPYLCSVASPADALRVDLHTTVTVSVEQAQETLKALCGEQSLGDPSAWFGEAVRTEAQTVKSVTVCGKTLEGRQIRDAFSLPSAAFEVQVQDGQVLFTVSGNGHFAGMSVCGATAMAQEGLGYEAILKHYYTGAVLT